MRFCIYILFGFSILACSGDVEEIQPLDMNQIQQDLIEANIKAAALESKQIDEYIEKKNIDAIKTPTGLRYSIYQNQDGEPIKTGQKAVVKYKVKLLNDTLCYSTEDGVEEFVVGKDYVESGLHEGITFLSQGDKATIIIPSHLAHGLAGDFKKIPFRSTIVYDIELIAIK